MERRVLEGISAWSLEELLEEGGEKPSAIIRSVRPGEGLWDIAKRYRTTEDEIADANALGNTTLFTGQMLLIPR